MQGFLGVYFQKQLSMQIYGIQMFRDLKMQLRYLLGLETYQKGVFCSCENFPFPSFMGMKKVNIFINFCNCLSRKVCSEMC